MTGQGHLQPHSTELFNVVGRHTARLYHLREHHHLTQVGPDAYIPYGDYMRHEHIDPMLLHPEQVCKLGSRRWSGPHDGLGRDAIP